MKEIKKPYNVYLIKRENGEEELKFIQGVYDNDYKLYLGLYILTDNEVKFPILNFETGEITLNTQLKKLDDRQKAIENLNLYIEKNNQKESEVLKKIKQFEDNKKSFLYQNDNDIYYIDFELHDQINILSQITLGLENIKINCIKGNDIKKYIYFSLEEAKKIYLELYNNLSNIIIESKNSINEE
jgi:hypothetical protein